MICKWTFLSTVLIFASFNLPTQSQKIVGKSDTLAVVEEFSIAQSDFLFEPSFVTTSPSGRYLFMIGKKAEYALYDLQASKPVKVVVGTVKFSDPSTSAMTRAEENFYRHAGRTAIEAHVDEQLNVVVVFKCGVVAHGNVGVAVPAFSTQVVTPYLLTAAEFSPPTSLFLGTSRGGIFRFNLSSMTVDFTIRPQDSAGEVMLVRVHDHQVFTYLSDYDPNQDVDLVQQGTINSAGLCAWNKNTGAREVHFKRWGNDVRGIQFVKSQMGVDVLALGGRATAVALVYPRIGSSYSDIPIPRAELGVDLLTDDEIAVRNTSGTFFVRPMDLKGVVRQIGSDAIVQWNFHMLSEHPACRRAPGARFVIAASAEKRVAGFVVKEHSDPPVRVIGETVIEFGGKKLIAKRAISVADHKVVEIIAVPGSSGQKWIARDFSGGVHRLDLMSQSGISVVSRADICGFASNRSPVMRASTDGSTLFVVDPRKTGWRVAPIPTMQFGAWVPIVEGGVSLEIEGLLPMPSGRVLVGDTRGRLLAVDHATATVTSVLAGPPPLGSFLLSVRRHDSIQWSFLCLATQEQAG